MRGRCPKEKHTETNCLRFSGTLWSSRRALRWQTETAINGHASTRFDPCSARGRMGSKRMIKIQPEPAAPQAATVAGLQSAAIYLEWLRPTAFRERLGSLGRTLAARRLLRDDPAFQVQLDNGRTPPTSPGTSQRPLPLREARQLHAPLGGGTDHGAGSRHHNTGNPTTTHPDVPARPIGLEGQFTRHQARIRSHLATFDRMETAHDVAARKLDALDVPLGQLRAELATLLGDQSWKPSVDATTYSTTSVTVTKGDAPTAQSPEGPTKTKDGNEIAA